MFKKGQRVAHAQDSTITGTVSANKTTITLAGKKTVVYPVKWDGLSPMSWKDTAGNGTKNGFRVTDLVAL